MRTRACSLPTARGSGSTSLTDMGVTLLGRGPGRRGMARPGEAASRAQTSRIRDAATAGVVDRRGRRRWTVGVSARPAPGAAMEYVVERAPSPPGRGAGVAGVVDAVPDRDDARPGRRRPGCRTPGVPPASRSGGMPKKQEPRPSSTAVCRISRLAIAASMCQNGIGQRASSSVGPALVGLGVPPQVGRLAGARHDHHRRAHHAGQPVVGGLELGRVGGDLPPAADVLGGVEHEEAQPWLKPALGARVALPSARSTMARVDRGRRRSCGSSGGGGRRPGTPWGAACLTTSSGCGPTSRRSGGRRRPAATSASRSPASTASCGRGSSSRRRAAGCAVEGDGFGNLVAWWRPVRGAARRGVLTGSHLDSVLDGGAYDGPLGVVSALAAVDVLRSRGFVPSRPIGVSVFVEEEGSRFGLACLGSRLATGALSLGRARASCGTGTGCPSRTRWRRRRASDRPRRRAAGPRRRCGTGSSASSSCTSSRDATWSTGARRSGWRARSGRTGATGSTSPAPRTMPGRPGWRTARDPMLTYAMTALAANKQARLAGQRATFGRLEVAPNGTNAIPSRVTALAGRPVLDRRRPGRRWWRRSRRRRPSGPGGTGPRWR